MPVRTIGRSRIRNNREDEWHRPAAAPIGDVFMLGQAFFALRTTGMDPLILQLDHRLVPRQLRPIIDRCCRPLKEQRYRSVDQLRRCSDVRMLCCSRR
jgi:hypothetical protein